MNYKDITRHICATTCYVVPLECTYKDTGLVWGKNNSDDRGAKFSFSLPTI